MQFWMIYENVGDSIMVQLTMEINLNPVRPNNKESLQKNICALSSLPRAVHLNTQ